MSRECIRYFSITYEYDIWILTIEETKFYNRFYAAISLIMGIGAAITFIANKPSYHYGSIRERTRTLNDSRVLNWVFIMWASELGSVFGIYFNASQSFYEFSLYPKYKYLFILFVIVLYLQQWTNFRRQFKYVSRKLIIPSTLIFVLLTFLIGQINFIDIESLNQKVLSKNPYNILEINKPESEYYTYVRNYSTTRQLYLGNTKENNSTKPKLMYERGLCLEINKVDSIVNVWKSKIPEVRYAGLTFQLNIDENIKMRYVNELKDSIESSKIFRLGYSVVPKGSSKFSQQRYKRNIIPTSIKNYKAIETLYPNRLSGKNIINIIPKNYDHLILNGNKISYSEFHSIIENEISDSSNYHFNLVYDDDLTYGRFIGAYSLIYSTIMYNRDKYSMAKYGQEYSWNSREIQKEIRRRYPLNIEDIEYQNK